MKSISLQRFLTLTYRIGQMKKLMMMALLAACVTANAQDRDHKDLTLKDGDNDSWTMQLGVGVNLVAGAPDGYDFAPFKSWDIQWTMAQYNYHPKGAKQTYSVGVGLTWRNYGMKDNGSSLEKVNGMVELGRFPDNAGSRSSRIRTLGIHVPLLFTQDLGKNFSFMVGPVINFTPWGWARNSYSIGDDDFSKSTRSIGQRPVTVDVMGVIDYGGVGIYCKYSPMSVFKKGRGPEFRSVTLGLYL